MLFKEEEKKNINIQINKNIFFVNVNSYKERYIERKSDIFYIIQITDNYLEKSWEIEKTLTDFQKLYEKIFILHPNIPLIPKNTPFKITSLHILDKRKFELQNFLRFCFNRKDILLNNDFINFVEIPQNCPKFVINYIKLVEEIKFDLSVIDMLYLKNYGILIILCVNTDFISSDEISLDNILMIRNNFSGKKTSLSYLFIYQYIKEKEKFIINNKLWEKSFFLRTELLTFDDNHEILCVGNEDGKIYLYKTKTKGDFQQIENFGELIFHSNKITGLYLNSDSMELYSCSKDCMFFVTYLKDNSFTKSLIYNNISGFTGLKYNKKYNIFLTCDEDGTISIFSFQNFHYIFLLNIQTTILDEISSMFIYDNFVFIGGKNGKLCLIEITNISKKEIKELKSNNIANNKINCITYNSKNNEIIIGTDKGYIIIWNNIINNYIYAWKGHSPYSVKKLWIEEQDEDVLWSSGNDKKIKKWKIPPKWFNDNVYFYSQEIEEKKNKKNIFNFGIDNDYSSSDEDDLNGWSK